MHRSGKVEFRRSLAALLREARTTYLLALRAHLAKGGFDDMPRDGIFTLATIRDFDAPASEIGRRMGASKQSISQLLATLEARGYLARSEDEEDRRRSRLVLTSRGAKAAASCRLLVDQMEARLVKIVGAKCVENTRTTLAALALL